MIIAKSLLHHIDGDQILTSQARGHEDAFEAGRALRDARAAYTRDMSKASRFVVSRDRGQSISRA